MSAPGGIELGQPAFIDVAPTRRPTFPLGLSVGASILVHVGLVLGVLAMSIFHPPPLLNPETLHVKLARIGTPRDKKLLPRRPTDPVSTPARPVPVSAKAVPVATSHPMPKLTAQKAQSSESRLRSALSKLQQQVNDQAGQADGFENGTDDATEGDLYWARVVDRIKRFYVVPNTIPQSERAKLVADVQVVIAADGTLLDIKTQSGSGNATFDRAIEAAVKRCRALPPPPAALAKQAREGVLLEFRSAEM